MVILRLRGGTVSLLRENDTAKPLAFGYIGHIGLQYSNRFETLIAIISRDFPVGSLLAN